MGKGALKTWHDFLKELKNSYGERFKMLARLPRNYTASGGEVVDDVRGVFP
jgi:hypothetical protein